MKKLLTIIAIALVTFPTPADAQDGSIYKVGTATDTAKPNTTKTQASTALSSDRGYTLQVWLRQITDTITGYISVWGSVDNVTFAPYPGIDSVAISAATDVKKLWFINTKANQNPIKYLQVRTRCPSNTTNATGKAKVTTFLYPY